MRRYLSALAAVAVLAGCARDQGDSQAAAGARVAAAPVSSAGLPLAPTGIPAARQPRSTFASLPDRGTLLSYDPVLKPRRTKAYTFHPVHLSEEHALRAIVDGTLEVRAPSGEVIRLRYAQHTEHPDGNWTWVGRRDGDQPGTEAIITFGEKAAFGSIPQSNGAPLRLTAAAGRAWLIETDTKALASMTSEAIRPTRSDAIAPPLTLAGGTAARAASSSTKAPSGAVATAAPASSTVDVVLGYTSGFATRLGGQSQANTRLTHLIAVTNQAYSNSQLNAAVRLVKTVQVNYTDSNSNSDALYALSGVSCTESSNGSLSCSEAAIPAALQPLHTARDQYGGDLVSLVRNFSDSAHGNCGLAWLNGAGQDPISSADAPWGMSVVGDSNLLGFTDGGHYCLDETLAHELAHNMGSAHERQEAAGDDGVLQANEYGRYPYSFGYAAGSFHTVMAYGGSNQSIIRVFSNPRISSCNGTPCGIADQADNVRSLSQTIPTIATFRASVVAVDPGNESSAVFLKAIDVNGNRKADLIYFQHGLNRISTWFMSGTTLTAAAGSTVSGSYWIVDTGDLDANLRGDLLLTSAARDVVLGISNGSTHTYTTLGLTYPAGYRLLGLGDINGDGRSDILVRNDTTGGVVVWYMSGTTRYAYNSHAFSAAWTFIGAADLNADNRADLIWQNESGRTYVSLSNGTTFTTSDTGLSSTATYPVLGLNDVNGDRRADIVLYSTSQNRIVVWYMNGATRFAYNAHVTPTGMRPMGRGDFDGNGRGDIVFQNPSTRALAFMLSSGSSFSTAALSSTPASDARLMDNE